MRCRRPSDRRAAAAPRIPADRTDRASGELAGFERSRRPPAGAARPRPSGRARTAASAQCRAPARSARARGPRRRAGRRGPLLCGSRASCWHSRRLPAIDVALPTPPSRAASAISSASRASIITAISSVAGFDCVSMFFERLWMRTVREAAGCSVTMPGWMLSREKKFPA